MKWLFALAALVIGGILGTLASAAVRRLLSHTRRPEKLRTLAPAAGSVVFSAVLAFAVVTSLSFLDKTAVDRLPISVMNAVPKFLVALVLVLVGNALASLVANLAGTAAVKASGRPQLRLVGLVRGATLSMFVLLAIAQIGVNTRIVDMAVAGIIGCLALSIALLTGLGGRGVASEVAAGRYLQRIVNPGDIISGEGFGGVVRGVWGATTELELPASTDGSSHVVHIPNTRLLSGNLRIERSGATPEKH